MVADRKEAHPVEKEKPGRTSELQRTNPPSLWKRITRMKKRGMLNIWQNNPVQRSAKELNPEETIVFQEVEELKELESGRVEAEARMWFAGLTIVVERCISSYILFANT